MSTRAAAKVLGIHHATLARYVAIGKIPAPSIVDVGSAKLHAWTEEEIERVQRLLPKITNGRKTRWQREREKKKAQPGEAVPHKEKRTKKKRSRRTD